MCEQTEINYLDGEVVWVKLGSCWWPGEVVGADRLPPDVLPSFKKPPIAVVKFFQESTYEYVKNINSIYKYNCSRKNEFIKKGLYMYRSKHAHMEKFPEDVIRAETEVGGDPDILTREEFQETKKESYAGIFGSAPKKTPTAGRGKGRPPITPKSSTPVRRVMREKSDYKVHILVQGSKTPSQATDTLSTPSTSRAGSESEGAEDRTPKADKPAAAFSTPTGAAGVYPCPLCSFTTTRLNVLILHNKTHSATFTPYTPSPVRKKPVAKSSPKATPNKTPKARKPRKEKTEKVVKKSQAQKRTADDQPEASEVKKPKTDEEIKSSLLADWDDGDDMSNDESPEAPSPELPTPAEPTPAELLTPAEPDKTDSLPTTEKLESTSDSKYEFCEDEDWSLEADAGRKIPRVKNPSKRKEERKSISIDDDDVAREVAELLNRTTVPELPAAPEPLIVEENFPEPSIVKSPDKTVESVPETSKPIEKPATEVQPTKAIFKTKTFFRSRHSRSQDAIGKYVAEQLNAERLDTESELNGSEMIPSPELRESPPIEPVKVARLAPKIQLKKMKAEAAQQRQKEKTSLELIVDDKSTANGANNKVDNFAIDTFVANEKQIDPKQLTPPKLPASSLDVLYPTQEIKPINKDTPYEYAKEKCDKLDQPRLDNIVKQDDVFGGAQKVDEKNDERTPNLDDMLQSNSQKPCEQNTGTFMNESTASAVDALLSVSREADRVTKTISDDLPEDLFEDDNKDNGGSNNINNGFCKESKEDNYVEENRQKPMEVEPIVEEVPMIEPVNENELDNGQQQNNVDNNVVHYDDNVPQQKDEINPQQNDEIIPQQHDENIVQQDNDNISHNNEGDLSQDNDLNQTNEHMTHNDVLIESEVPMTDVNNEEICETVVDNAPSESDLQIAEALINLPATAIKNITSQHQDNLNLATHFSSEPFQEEVIQTANNVEVNDEETGETMPKDQSVTESNLEAMDTSNNDSINARYETEEEKSENLYAAQSLVEMSESIEHKIKVAESKLAEVESTMKTINTLPSKILETSRSVEQNVASLSSDNNSDPTVGNAAKFETSSSKLLKILEEPCVPKVVPKTPTKQIVMTGKEKILNFDVSKATIKGKPQSPKQKIIIRRNTPSKAVINNLTEIAPPENIILSRSSKPPDGSSVQTYTITSTPEPAVDPSTIIIQQKIRKIAKPAPKLQKLKQQYSLVAPVNETKPVEQTPVDDTIYDINSMPIVLSDDILTPENIEKMPIVMSDGKIITNPANPPKLIKSKHVESEKKVISSPSKPELKTLLMNPTPEVSKGNTPNILSKSAKLRGSKPMLVIDKATGKQKIIMTKPETTVKEIKQAPQKLETTAAGAGGKFIILPAGGTPQPTRTQKIVIDPQTGKAHVLVSKPEPADNKPVSAKLLPPPADGPGNTVMIITNAQGAQSRIVLTPEHEKILFPNKQQKVSQLKTVTQRVATGVKPTAASTGPAKIQNTKIVPKQQKSAIITSKGQLIVGGRVATTAQNIAPMPEIRPRQRVVAAEPRKLAQAVQKTSSEPLIFLQQKSGQVMQLTAAQFEHLKRTGQIVQKGAAENKPVVQKTMVIPAGEGPLVQKKLRRPAAASPTPAKRVKQEVPIAPAPAPAPVPALAPLAPAPAPALAPAPAPAPAPAYPDLENFEELLPSTAIVRSDPVPAPEPPPAPLADGQLLAVPGEHFGGPPGSFYLCVEDAGSLTPIDNRPLVLENNQLVPMGEPAPPERRDILEAALANSDVFHEPPRDDPPFRDLNANVSVHCRVSETSSAQQPIMTPVEVPSLGAAETEVPATLEAGLAVIGVTPHVPTTLELPITVTDPRIAPRVADPLGLLPEPELPFAPDDTAVTGAISMPLLMEEEAVGKSMPLLTDEPPSEPAPAPAPAWRNAAATS